MGIVKDAEELLVFLYKEYITSDFMMMTHDYIKTFTNWDQGRISRTVAYLTQKGFIKVEGDDRTFIAFVIMGLLPDGINTIEREDQFKEHFNHTIDLKFYKFSWGATEK